MSNIMSSDEYRIFRLEIEPLRVRVRELEEANAELVQKLSALADYFDLEWYDVPGRGRYVRKEENE